MTKSMIVLMMGAMLMALFLQCGGPGTPEPPAVEAPTEAPQPPPEEPTAPPPATPTPTAQAQPPAMGLSRDNPVPLGHTLIASDGAAVTVHGIAARGEEAARRIEEWNMFNPDAGEGNEYVIVSATVRYEGGEQETLHISSLISFRMVASGVIIEAPMIVGDQILEGEMFAGGQLDGFAVFEVPQGSTALVLIYTVLMRDSYYFATE